MKFLFLPLVFLVSVSFAGETTAEPQTQTAAFFCTDCWNYANDKEDDAGGNNFEVWQNAYDDCNENKNPCAGQMEPVTIELKE